MSVKGLQATITLAATAIMMLVAGISLDFHRLDFSIYSNLSAQVNVSLTTADFEDFPQEILRVLFQNPDERRKFQEFSRTPKHKLQDVKDIFCSLTRGYISGEILSLCEQLNAYYYGGMVMLGISVAAIMMETVGCFYLTYYLTGRAKKGCRRMAMMLFIIAPAAEITALLMYCAVIVTTASHDSGWIRVIVTWTPGAGLILTILACFALFVTPCLSERWKLEKNELVDEEQLLRKQKAEDKFLGELCAMDELAPTFPYGTGYLPTSLNEERLFRDQHVNTFMNELYPMDGQETPSFSYSARYVPAAPEDLGGRETINMEEFFYEGMGFPTEGYNEAAVFSPSRSANQLYSSPSISEIPFYDPYLAAGRAPVHI